MESIAVLLGFFAGIMLIAGFIAEGEYRRLATPHNLRYMHGTSVTTRFNIWFVRLAYKLSFLTSGLLAVAGLGYLAAGWANLI